jgi:hypothetical protein
MSTASCVRETWDLTGDDAWKTLAATGRFKLVRDVVALQMWTSFSAIAIFLGAAIAAQLEAVRSGTQTPPRA